MKSSLLFNSTFKCYKISTKTASSEINGIFDDTFKGNLKELVIDTIYKDIQLKKQNETLLNGIYDYHSDDHELNELNGLIRVDHKYESAEVESSVYQINYVSIRSNDSNIFRPQLFIFITDIDSLKNYNTILLVRSIPKLNNVLLRFLVNEKGILASQLKISSQMLKQCLDSSVEELVTYKSNLELTFSNFGTINNDLSSITLNIQHDDLKRLFNSDSTLSEELFKYLNSETAIAFDKIDLVKVSCNMFYISGDGRLKLFDDYNIGQITRDHKFSWSIIQRLF